MEAIVDCIVGNRCVVILKECPRMTIVGIVVDYSKNSWDWDWM